MSSKASLVPGPPSNQTEDNVPSQHKSQARGSCPASICLDWCSHGLVAAVAREAGMQVVAYESVWDVLWADPGISQETHKRMKRFQRINQFPLISELCRKSLLARNLHTMRRLFPQECRFFPTTWSLPTDSHAVHAALASKQRVVILKPDNGSNGAGISLVRRWSQIHMEPGRSYICQEYIAHPFLIDGKKFDIRVYTLVTSCAPLRVYVHREGLARFATVRYEPPAPGNLSNKFMHLTNYTLNKTSVKFLHDEEVGSKRSLSTINQWFLRNSYDVEKIWARIDDVIVKTILSAQASLQGEYSAVFSRHTQRPACFQLLGFDILLDEALHPYVLEVNRSPSFHSDTPIDVEIKSKVLQDTFSLCNLPGSIRREVQREERQELRRRLYKQPPKESRPVTSKTASAEDFKEQWAWEASHRGDYRLVYPCAEPQGQKYDEMLQTLETASHYKDTFSSQVRAMMGRAQRSDIENKRNSHRPDSTQQTCTRDIENRSYTRELERIYGPKTKSGQNKPGTRQPLQQVAQAQISHQKKSSCTTGMAKRIRDREMAKIEKEKIAKDKEIMKRLAEEWLERKQQLEEMGLHKMIFNCFKEQDNLSKRDWELYKHLLEQ